MSATRLVIVAVALALCLAVLGVVVLAVLGQPVPGVLENVAIAALTGLVGLLVPARTGDVDRS